MNGDHAHRYAFAPYSEVSSQKRDAPLTDSPSSPSSSRLQKSPPLPSAPLNCSPRRRFNSAPRSRPKGLALVSIGTSHVCEADPRAPGDLSRSRTVPNANHAPANPPMWTEPQSSLHGSSPHASQVAAETFSSPPRTPDGQPVSTVSVCTVRPSLRPVCDVPGTADARARTTCCSISAALSPAHAGRAAERPQSPGTTKHMVGHGRADEWTNE